MEIMEDEAVDIMDHDGKISSVESLRVETGGETGKAGGSDHSESGKGSSTATGGMFYVFPPPVVRTSPTISSMQSRSDTAFSSNPSEGNLMQSGTTLIDDEDQPEAGVVFPNIAPSRDDIAHAVLETLHRNIFCESPVQQESPEH